MKTIKLILLSGISLIIGPFCFSQTSWALEGNSGLTGSDLLGTLDSSPLKIATDGQTRMYLDANGNVGIGTSFNSLVAGTRLTVAGGSSYFQGTIGINAVPNPSTSLKIYIQEPNESYGIQVIAPSAWNKAIVVRDAITQQDVFRVSGNGQVHCQGLRVKMAPFPDYVFEDGYKLMSLDSLGHYIKANHALPEMPRAGEIEKEGADLGELCRLQQQKIEELSLYLIALNAEIQKLKAGK